MPTATTGIVMRNGSSTAAKPANATAWQLSRKQISHRTGGIVAIEHSQIRQRRQGPAGGWWTRRVGTSPGTIFGLLVEQTCLRFGNCLANSLCGDV